MNQVMEAMCSGQEDEEEERVNLFDDDQPDDTRDECIRLLLLELERGARAALPGSPVISRIIREYALMARVPQLLNEAVLGVAIARQQDQKPRDCA
jgi:hypothetical protein